MVSHTLTQSEHISINANDIVLLKTSDQILWALPIKLSQAIVPMFMSYYNSRQEKLTKNSAYTKTQ